MFNISKWAVLVLAVLSFGVVGCGDDDTKDNGGAGGSAGSDDGTAGTDEGTAGTDDGNGDYEPDCTALCDNVYRCGGFQGVDTVEECYAICEDGGIEPTWMECFETTEACEELSACTQSCESRAVDACTAEGGACEQADWDVLMCAVDNGCTDLFTFFDEACYLEHCSEADAAWVSCIENDCEEYKACQE